MFFHHKNLKFNHDKGLILMGHICPYGSQHISIYHCRQGPSDIYAPSQHDHWDIYVPAKDKVLFNDDLCQTYDQYDFEYSKYHFRSIISKLKFSAFEEVLSVGDHWNIYIPGQQRHIYILMVPKGLRIKISNSIYNPLSPGIFNLTPLSTGNVGREGRYRHPGFNIIGYKNYCNSLFV